MYRVPLVTGQREGAVVGHLVKVRVEQRQFLGHTEGVELAAISGPLERLGDQAWVFPGKDACLKVKRIAALGDFLRPAFGLLLGHLWDLARPFAFGHLR